jgi:hypothetical protein
VLEDNLAMVEVFRRGPGTMQLQTRGGVSEITLLFGPLDAVDVELLVSST